MKTQTETKSALVYVLGQWCEADKDVDVMSLVVSVSMSSDEYGRILTSYSDGKWSTICD